MSFVLDERLPTPRLQVDAEIFEQNLHRMAEYAERHQLRLRPHTKTHKSLYVAQRQLDLGASGLTVAKVGEAQVMAQVCDDILIAYPTVDSYRCRAVAELAGQVRLLVAIDSTLAAEVSSREAARRGTTVGVLIDVDLGYRRTGMQSDHDALELAQRVEQLPGLRLDGIMTYTGHIQGTDDQQRVAFAQVRDRLAELLRQWNRSGLSAEIVSGGSTPSALHCHLAEYLTEIRPGTYVYNDMNTVRGGYVTVADCAARIVSTVISDAVPGQIVLDAGSKTLTSDLCGPAPDSGHGLIVEYPQAKICRLTEEHAQVDVSASDPRPRLGEQVTIVPNHICVCVNMQSEIWWQGPDDVPRTRTVDARGLLV